MGDAQRRLRRSLSSVDRPSIDRHNRIEIHRLADLVDEARSVPGGAKRRLQDLSLLRRTAWLLRCLVDQTLDSDLLGRLPTQSLKLFKVGGGGLTGFWASDGSAQMGVESWVRFTQ